MNLKKLMLLPLICCVSMQQTDAKVIYSPNKTETFAQKINEKTNKNKHATINDIAPEAFASLLPVTKYWYNYDNDILKYFNNNWNWEHYYQFSMPGIAAFVPTKNRYNAKVYVGWKYQYYSTDPKTTPPKNTPNETYGDAPLFEYSDYSHTERQLAICALNNADTWNNKITTDSPHYHILNKGNTPNIGDTFNINDNDKEKAVKKIQKPAAGQLTDQMENTEGILCIYTRALPCTSSQDFKENGDMLCVDYYAHLLRVCPKINIHVYCDKNEVVSLSSYLLDKVDCRLIYTTMIEFFKTIIVHTKHLHPELGYYTSTIKHITSGNIVPTESGWQFTKIPSYAGGKKEINRHVISAIREYIQTSEDTATGGKILTALIRLLLNQSGSAAPKETYDTTFDRLIMHLI